MKSRDEIRNTLIDNYIENVFKPTFPNIRFTSAEDWFSKESDPIRSLEITLSKTFYALGNSFLSHSGNKFLHFTSIPKLYSILYSQVFRLYDFNNLDDDMEFKYAYQSKDRALSEYDEKELKRKIHNLSFIEDNYDTVYHNDFDYMWCNYADHHEGVCLKIEIENVLSDNTAQYMLGKIQYEEDKLKGITELENRHKAFCDSNNLQIGNFNELIHFICSFFKESGYTIEKEVRLLRISDYFSSNSNMKSEINRKLKHVTYDEIPINGKCPPCWNKEIHESYINTTKYPLPKITIKEIWFGKGVSLKPAKFFESNDALSKLIKSNYNINLYHHVKNTSSN